MYNVPIYTLWTDHMFYKGKKNENLLLNSVQIGLNILELSNYSDTFI